MADPAPPPIAGDYVLKPGHRLEVGPLVDYATLEFRPSQQRFVVHMLVEEISTDEAHFAAQQLDDLGKMGARINRGGSGL